MPIFAQILSWLGLGALFQAESQAAAIAARALKTAAFVAVVVGLTVGLIATLNGLGSGIQQTLPSNVAAVASSVFPRNLNACLGVLITARIARWIYDWHISIARNLSQ